MREIRYLTGTNAVIDYLARKMPENGMNFMNKVVNSIPNISIITKIEVLGLIPPLNILYYLEAV